MPPISVTITEDTWAAIQADAAAIAAAAPPASVTGTTAKAA